MCSAARWSKTKITAMIKVILLDLDNTLLQNPDRRFAQAFNEQSRQFFMQQWGFDGFPAIFKQAIQAAGKRARLDYTNSRITVELLSQQAGIDVTEAAAGLQTFYREVYPALRAYTSPVEAAANLVADLKRRGYAVVIATNPIYPAEAIYQRLAWGRLPCSPDDYSFISHADNMHFAKPDAAYYAEILARVGTEPDEAVMVGDSVTNDIQPAHAIGLHTFQVSADYIENGPADQHGTLQDFHRLITSVDWLETRTAKALTPAMIEPELRGNVGALFGLLDGVQPHFWSQHPDPEEWSILQIVCHLLESESTIQRPRLERILSQDNAFLAAPNSPLGPQQYECEASGQEYAYRFAAEREKTLALLRSLKPQDWSRPARHSIFGPTTLLEMAHFTAQHDRLHLNQLCQTIGNCE
jgi:HAD superfamily hydrolase (TIGR01549 family)